ncbi:MAG: electron transporter, partial [Desulfuromonadaceae bacterium]|nr:electron transporter [Desulfuromonadaceae bacterium]
MRGVAVEATRQIYWNVGHGVVIPMYILAAAAFGYMVWGFRQRLPIWRQGKALDRFDRFDERVKLMIGEVFSQSKIYRVTDGGIFHSIFFWSFLILFAGTIMVMFQADLFTPLLQVNLLSGEFYKAFSLVLDIAGILAIVMLAGLFVRRFVIRPEGLEIVKDDYIVLQLLFAILITGFLIEGAR